MKWGSIASAASKAWVAVIRAASAAFTEAAHLVEAEHLMEAVGAAVGADNHIEPTQRIID